MLYAVQKLVKKRFHSFFLLFILNINIFTSSDPSLYIKYFIQKIKVIQTTNSGAYDFEYQEYVKQYLQIDDQIIPLKSWRMIYRILPEMGFRSFITLFPYFLNQILFSWQGFKL